MHPISGFEMIADGAPYSYKDDPAVLDFPDDGPVTVMDAHCSLCARGARWIARNDHRNEFRIVPVQSQLGEALLRHYGLDPADPVSWLYLEDGRAYSSLDAVMRAGLRLGGVWKALAVLRILPGPLRDLLYRMVARNRYRIFGKTDLCSLPDEQIQRRLIR